MGHEEREGSMDAASLRGAEADPDKEIREDRLARDIPWTLSPFEVAIRTHRGSYLEPQILNAYGQKRRTLQTAVKTASDGPWVDLMLDLAMATTFANLTSNTKILTGINAMSYICFFSLVWWIWTSQVAYNVRFRQEDRLHRIYVFLQLCVFAALSAFTTDFDVTSGIDDTSADDRKLNTTLSALGWSAGDANAFIARNSRLPILNERGISMSMALSRLLLFVQYAVVFWHAGRLRNFSLAVPLITLFISFWLYMVAFIISKDATREVEIIKLTLWFAPVVIEALAHYVELYLPESVGYPRGTAFYERCSTLMTVIMGEGLNGITGVFRFCVGNLGFNAGTLGNIFSTIVIVYAQFSLYFEGSNKLGSGDALALTWTLLHFIYFGCLILVLQAVENILLFTNLMAAAYSIVDFLVLIQDGNYAPLAPNTTAGQAFEKALGKLGSSWFDELTLITNPNVTAHDAANHLTRWEVYIFYTIAKQFDAAPEPDSPTYFKLSQFLGDDTLVNSNSTVELTTDIFTPHARSTLWFAGTAGGTLMCLALLNVVQRWPRDKYGWATIISRFFVGLTISLLSLFNMGKNALDIFENENSPIWKFLISGWMLPSLALALSLQVAIDWIILFLSVRKIKRRKWTLPSEDQDVGMGLLRNVSQSSRRPLTKEGSFDVGTTIPIPEGLSYQMPYTQSPGFAQMPYSQSPGFAHDLNYRHEE